MAFPREAGVSILFPLEPDEMEMRGPVRNTALLLGLCATVIFGQSQLDLKGFGEGFKPDPMPVVWNAPQNSVFYDHPLVLRQYGLGIAGSIVAGALGFYIGNAFDGAFNGHNSHEGYLSFTGVRFKMNSGPFWGGGTGVILGSTLTAFFVGETDEEEGSVFWTVLGGTATTALAFVVADWAGVQKFGQHPLLPFIPLLAIPTTGAVTGYQVSRWFNDKKRRKITEPNSSALLLPPRLAIAPRPDGMAFKLDAINLSF